ncbi:hypothetical protein BS333_08665 [Vibrio azureus]|nr:hypothetical protein BS333_08665 [Vibrio azureus]
MSFSCFFENIRKKISLAKSLEELIVRQRRTNIGNSGLTFKHSRGRLVEHRYHRDSLSSRKHC